MKRVLGIIAVVILLAGAGTAGLWWYTKARASDVVRPLEASGTIEAETIHITAETSGRIVEILADEGQPVNKGQVLLRLDDSLLQTQRAQAEAAVAAAQADLAQVEAKARPEEIAVARAAVAQAVAQRDGAKVAWDNAKKARDNPQQLNAEIHAAQNQVALAKLGVEMAQARLADALLLRDQYKSTSYNWRVLNFMATATEEAVAEAQAAQDGAQQHLDNLIAMRNNPLAADAAVTAAEGKYRVAEAAVNVAQAALDALLEGAMPEEIAIAQARVRQAQASLHTLDVQLEQLTIKSPINGLVTSKVVHVGEIATPGATLMTVADLDQVTLTIYVPENRINMVALGQAVGVEVDSFPNEVFQGEVTYIAHRAEFTPKNVQTKEERVNMVFAVKVRIPNPDHRLKPGMPADAIIGGD
ncbi:MAG TPA: HlyD family efflux transporter periplasmic adaptor subunit [Anaerolineae bacterium]|nr:HlyD family efflux transporter periplasmic adaptor subunit [Anaerolineae bacterium]